MTKTATQQKTDSRSKMKLLLTVAACAAAAATANASISITSYDISNAAPSGFGNWAHTYTGTITGSGPSNYTGGSGTLNDGSHGTSRLDTQLFDATVGPVITLHLNGFYTISSISVFGGDFGNNFVPGVINSMDVSFGGPAYTQTSTPFGFPALSGPASDLFGITGPLAGVSTDKIVLSGFSPLFVNLAFSIAEIEVDGVRSIAAVPEPSTYLAGLSALGMLGLFGWRNRK